MDAHDPSRQLRGLCSETPQQTPGPPLDPLVPTPSFPTASVSCGALEKSRVKYVLCVYSKVQLGHLCAPRLPEQLVSKKGCFASVLTGELGSGVCFAQARGPLSRLQPPWGPGQLHVSVCMPALKTGVFAVTGLFRSCASRASWD